MNKIKRKNLNKKLRKQRTRAKVFGTKQNPRLSVFRSNKYTYAQLIDDENGKTLAAISTMDIKDGNKIKQAKEIGQKLAEKAKKLGVKSVIFDRGHYKYHGRVEAVASGAREGGLKF